MPEVHAKVGAPPSEGTYYMYAYRMGGTGFWNFTMPYTVLEQANAAYQGITGVIEGRLITFELPL